ADLRVLTGPGKATLTWAAGPSPVREYLVYRAQAEEPYATRFEKVAAVKGTRYEDKGRAAGKVYYYTVRAVGQDGKEGPPSFRARTQPRVLLQPVASVPGAEQVELSWNRHPAADVVGYNVYRGKALMRDVKQGVLKPWRDNDPE